MLKWISMTALTAQFVFLEKHNWLTGRVFGAKGGVGYRGICTGLLIPPTHCGAQHSNKLLQRLYSLIYSLSLKHCKEVIGFSWGGLRA